MAGFDLSKGAGTKEITIVEVRNPVTYHDLRLKVYTDYEVCIKTTSKAFLIPQTFVRRRYSDFVWLRNWLEKNNDAFARLKMPKMPPKKLVGRNDPEFVQKRMRGLQKFLKKIIEHNVFLSDKALHLFLQSGMNVKQIEYYLTDGIRNDRELHYEDSGSSINDDALVNHFENEKIRSQSALQHINEIFPRGDDDEDSSNCGTTFSSSVSSISSSLLDSFEAINVDDCTPLDIESSIEKDPTTLLEVSKSLTTKDSNNDDTKDGKHVVVVAEKELEEDNQSQTSLDGFNEDDIGLNLCDHQEIKSQTSSNNSLAECDRIS